MTSRISPRITCPCSAPHRRHHLPRPTRGARRATSTAPPSSSPAASVTSPGRHLASAPSGLSRAYTESYGFSPSCSSSPPSLSPSPFLDRSLRACRCPTPSPSTCRCPTPSPSTAPAISRSPAPLHQHGLQEGRQETSRPSTTSSPAWDTAQLNFKFNFKFKSPALPQPKTKVPAMRTISCWGGVLRSSLCHNRVTWTSLSRRVLSVAMS